MEDFVGMIKTGKRQTPACIALCVMLVLILTASSQAALFGLIKTKKNDAPVAVKQSLVIFPFDKDIESAQGVPDQFGDNIAGYLRTALANSKGYSAYLYDARLMPIKRAVNDNYMREQDTKAPYFAEKQKSAKLAQLLAANCYIIGSIEGYTYDRAKKTVELTLKADLIQADSGRMVQEFLVAATAGDGNQAAEEDELRSLAAGKAVTALTEKILGTSPADVKAKTAEKPAKKKK